MPLFHPALPEPRLRLSEYAALQCFPVRDNVSCRTSRMDVGVTRLADDQRFALARRHDCDPKRPFGLPLAPQVLERSNMVDLNVVL